MLNANYFTSTSEKRESEGSKMSSPNASQPIVNERAKSNLSRVALFLGELRDGLTMVRFYKHKKGLRREKYSSSS
jgi:hypothetical protein